MAKIIKLEESRMPGPKNSEPSTSCDHKSVIAYTSYRTVQCATCGAELDCFDVLVDMIKGQPPTGRDKDGIRRFERELEKRRQE